ncbi:hypothetical protein J2S04_002871 [Alicyclobacillus tengchongensis]|uniref:Uncharacterized protein n=1 Tax=Alicyclobacillus tolerans TaxID=90970 RepID=A0ABT9M033_9BACL|nr:hypothetical protein [Alicyclobacillus tengchongensis]
MIRVQRSMVGWLSWIGGDLRWHVVLWCVGVVGNSLVGFSYRFARPQRMVVF